MSVRQLVTVAFRTNNTTMQLLQERMDVNQFAYLRAKYTKALDKNAVDQALLDHLVRMVIAGLPTCVHSKCGIGKLVMIYFGQGISLVSVRKDFRGDAQEAGEYLERVRAILDELRGRTMQDVEEVLSEAERRAA